MNLTPAQIERLALIAEEAAEVIQAVNKIIRHGYQSHHPASRQRNKANLEHEIGDLLAVCRYAAECGDFSQEEAIAHGEGKMQRCAPYLHHQSAERV